MSINNRRERPKMDAIRKNTRYCQFTESQAGDGETGDITGEPGWGDVCPDSHLLFRGYFLRDQRIAEKGRTEEICKIGTGSEGTDSWQDSTRNNSLGLFSAFWARYVSKGEETGC